MINKKLSKTLGPVLGIMGFMLTIGVMDAPVLADTTSATQISNITTPAAITTMQNNDYFVNINKVVSQNGIKVTFEKVLVTKHKIKATVKIESNTPFDTNSYTEPIYNISYGNDFKCNTHDVSEKHLDDKTILLTIEKENYETEYPAAGNIRLDVALPEYKVNIGIDASVDFSESFKNVFEKKVSGKIPEFDYTLNEIEADAIGLRINYTEPKWDESRDSRQNSIWNSTMLLKLGDKYYKVDSNGNYSDSNDILMGNYKTNLLNYDMVKDEKNISILPIISYMTSEDFHNVNKLSQDKASEDTKDTKNNISYPKNYTFSDGTKGEIYKIERANGLVKIYLKGTSEKESLLMATNMFIHYIYGKNDLNHNYIKNDDITLYKDPNEALSYITEFKDPEIDKALNINFDDSIILIDKYKLGNEIKLTD
ncbi:DUF4179 domain-containing protein [Clostridium saccharoperbutylacetonicum]|uniref:DUF4179 domain-containing protein n=1 Tax=Clostridium saccharoperbutylacetonicum TaxID=36745 RepID=UPI0039E92FD6